MTERIERVVIAGGGTAGWMTAAALARALANSGTSITLVESDEIGTIGVGEATIPAFHNFNYTLGLDQADFMRSCNATFKLGIEFVDWREPGHSYIHPFTRYGRDFNNVFFHELFLRYARISEEQGESVAIDDYNLCCVAAREGRFAHPVASARLNVAPLHYAFQFDASLYARYLRKFSEQRGVARVEGKIAKVRQDGTSGHILSLELENGRDVEGDLFVDCTGQRAVLIGQTMGVGYEEWRHWLPCDSAIAAQTPNVQAPLPYTRSTADSAGWRWRIPLQHRVGNGYVYSSDYISHEDAERRLLETIDGEPLREPRRIPFKTGRRSCFWMRNCVAIGLAAGFLEPLESTSIHLIQTAVLKLLALFPDKAFEPADRDAFNRHTIDEYERIRDFLILHYKVTNRTDPFWRQCREMDVPDSLREAIELFESRGRMFITQDHLFNAPSWLAVMLGQGLRPRGYDPLADTIPEEELKLFMADVRNEVATTAAAMPTHAEYISRFCASDLYAG
jgi:tryptophan halogenase